MLGLARWNKVRRQQVTGVEQADLTPGETGPATADAAAQANVDASGSPGQTTHGGTLQLPDPTRQSSGVQGYLALHEQMREEIRGKYANGDRALERLENLSPREQEELRQDPTVLGKLADGVDGQSVNTGHLAEGARSFEAADKTTKKGMEKYDHQVAAYNQQQNGIDQGQEVKGLESQMNQSLTSVASMTHHLSI